ncbi:uncharacterized mitochondrial protein AtMg00810-like [Lactuca sativa]|uniref:uncharacterized mitochondrial protein AtMg00810-like n=1 Tax=Lactuca sativa TaxID=4236 RepID=UPI000CD9C7C7|nr:uncharacterized mitochondrial protein AtMg00810-like [Lactuca sativa]
MNVDDEGEHQNVNPIVEGEKVGNRTNVSNEQTDNFHDINDNFSNASERSETREINFLGLNIRQRREGIFINQEKYTRNLLDKFGITNNTKLIVLMAVGTKLCPLLDKHAIDITLYRSMIGSLLYLTASRPDIMFSVCNCASYQSNPREPHLTVVKNIFHYLKRTISLALWYLSKTGFFIQAFSDVCLGGCNLDRKSTSGGCQLLDGKLVSWQSKKQTCV